MSCDDCGERVKRDKPLRFSDELVDELLENYNFDSCGARWSFCESDDQSVLIERRDFVGERVVGRSVLVCC